MQLIIAGAIFITTLLMVQGGWATFQTLHNPHRKRMRARLQTLAAIGNPGAPIDIVRRHIFSEVPFLDDLLARASWVQDLARILAQGRWPYPMGVFLLVSLLLALMGLWLGLVLFHNFLFGLLGAPCWGMLPFAYVYWRKMQRMLQFQRQLPDGLDLIARALKAGHTFIVGMKMVGDEFPEPIGPEFHQTLDEINFGVGVPEALMNLAQRVDCPDLKFFVTSLLIQRETGGNLAEIAENISHLIRQRFELQGRIRVLAAEGKISATILLALPILVALALLFLNPRYLLTLVTDSLGKMMLGFCAGMMVVGCIVIKLMIRIRV